METVLIIDTTYFGRRWHKDFFGIMVFRSHELKKNLLWKEISRENKQSFINWVKELESKWRKIKAIVSDGKKWVLWAIPWIPSQMCHFHQKQIIQRYITKDPILEANIELKEISESIWKFSRETLKLLIDDWYERYVVFLKEKNANNQLIHKRTLQAYYSIRNNLKHLYPYRDYRWVIDIPPTTNSLESTFSRLKTYLWVHRWLTKERKLKFIITYLQK